MSLVSADKISKRFSNQVILDGVSFTITAESRIGVVGKNGIGKTTLFELIAGLIEPDSGTVSRSRSCTIEYVEQEKDEYAQMTLFEYVSSARQDLIELRAEIDKTEEYLTQHPHDSQTVAKLGEMHHRYESADGFNYEYNIERVLGGLGFTPDRFQDKIEIFSGGEKNRASLARLLMGKGNLLLLDEPTNHLDIDSTAWLEDYLKSCGKAFLVISHDRTFLSNLVNTVWEIAWGKIENYIGTFERYMVERVERREQMAKRYAHQQAEISRIEDFIRRNMAGQKTKQAKSRLKYLDRLERLPQPRADATAVSPMVMKTSGRSFNHVLTFEGVSLGYDGTPLLSDVSFELYRGDKIGVIGRNGAGKSTLLRALVGELEPMSGHLKLGSQVDVAYFDQELGDLNLQATVIDNLWECDPLAYAEVMRSFLARFGFTGEDPFKLVSSLSGGEKTKLALARLLYHPSNFIIFDEPTNHLDIDARETLEDALREFEGSCLIVSHDRYFLDRVCDKILNIQDGKAKLYLGNYTYFKDKISQPAQPMVAPKPKSESTKNEYIASKEKAKLDKKRKTELQQAKNNLEKLEDQLKQVEYDLLNTVPKDDWTKLEATAKQKQKLENEILNLYEEIEQMEQEENG